MGTIRFILRQPKTNKEQTIFIAYNFDRNNKLLISTKSKITPKFWNSNRQKVGNYSEVKNKDIINNSLNDIKTNLEIFISECNLNKLPITKELLKTHIVNYFNPKKPQKNETTLFEFINTFIDKSKTRINPKTGKLIQIGTIAEYKQTQRLLKEYCTDRKKTIDFNDITLVFYYDFIDFLQEKNLATNTIGHKIVTLKTFLTEATERNINTNMAFKSSKFRVLSEDVENVYLSEIELKKIYDYDFTSNSKLERVRDIFVIASYTGLRFSDLNSINDNIRDDKIFITQSKTGAKVVIPLHPLVKETLKKHENKLPPLISNQKFNKYIKEVCRLVGITEKVERKTTKGGIKEVAVMEKWQRIGTHTARRSFATNLYKNGFPSLSIMQITGHKTEAAFMKYIKVTPEEHANLLNDFWNRKNN